jgi:hypothetical protein
MLISTFPFDTPIEMRSFRVRPFNIQSMGSQTRELIPGGLMVARWEVKMTMPDFEEARWREHDGLITELEGINGRIRLFDPARKEPMYNRTVTQTEENWDDDTPFDDNIGWGTGPLPPYVYLAETVSRGDNYMRLGGFPASIEGALRRGDLFEVLPNGVRTDHSQLHVVTRWAKSDADGELGVYFSPGMRSGGRSGDMVILGDGKGVRPMGVFRLSSDEEGSIEVRAPSFGSMGLTFTEVVAQA